MEAHRQSKEEGGVTGGEERRRRVELETRGGEKRVRTDGVRERRREWCRCARAALGEREGARRRLGTAALCAGERRREVAAWRRTSRAAAARCER